MNTEKRELTQIEKGNKEAGKAFKELMTLDSDLVKDIKSRRAI